MRATAEEAREQMSGCTTGSGRIRTRLSRHSRDAVGSVPWWPEDHRKVTLHWILVHVIAERRTGTRGTLTSRESSLMGPSG